MDLDPDRDLVRDLASDDAPVRRRALGALYDRHHGRVFNVAYRVMGTLHDAADVAQEVFLQISERIRSFRGDSSFTSWVYRMTVNLAIDARRRRARRRAGSIESGEEEGADVLRPRPGTATPPEDPEQAAERAERELRVHAALDALSPKLRAVVVLRYFENLSYEELAEVLKTGIGTVKSRLNRAHAALEKALKAAGDGGPAENA